MSIKKSLFFFLILVFLMFSLASCGNNEYGLNMNAENVVKIERLFRRFETTAYDEYFTDKSHIEKLIAFFNSLNVAASEPFMDTARPPMYFRIIYEDGTTDFIAFHYTSLFFNNNFYRITDEDRGLARSRELDNMIYGLHDESRRLRQVKNY